MASAPPGKNCVTGDREVATALTIHPAGNSGASCVEPDDHASLPDLAPQDLGRQVVRWQSVMVWAPRPLFIGPFFRSYPEDGCHWSLAAVKIVQPTAGYGFPRKSRLPISTPLWRSML